MLGARAEQPLATVHTMPNGWEALPEELLLMALERLSWARRESAAVRLTSSRWRRIHDEGRKTLELRGARATDEAVVALCGRMPALTKLILYRSSLVTDQGLQAVAELKALTFLSLDGCHTSVAAEEELRRQIPGLHIVHAHETYDVESYESDVESQAELSD